jgi:hypothetical protein
MTGHGRQDAQHADQEVDVVGTAPLRDHGAGRVGDNRPMLPRPQLEVLRRGGRDNPQVVHHHPTGQPGQQQGRRPGQQPLELQRCVHPPSWRHPGWTRAAVGQRYEAVTSLCAVA